MTNPSLAELENDVLRDVVFIGGCNGNLQGIASLVKGMKANEILVIID